MALWEKPIPESMARGLGGRVVREVGRGSPQAGKEEMGKGEKIEEGRE